MAVKNSNNVVSTVLTDETLIALDRVTEMMDTTRSKCIAQIVGTYMLDKVDVVTPEAFDASYSGLASALRKATK